MVWATTALPACGQPSRLCITALHANSRSWTHHKAVPAHHACCAFSAHRPCNPMQLDVAGMAAHVRYPETDEEEDIDLKELMAERCVAVRAYQAFSCSSSLAWRSGAGGCNLCSICRTNAVQ